MKQKLFFFAVMMMALAVSQNVKAYDFSKSYQGQMLYYKVIDPVNHYVMLTHPKDTLSGDEQWSIMNSGTALWDTNNRPFGALVLPDTVSHDGIIYTVRAIGAYTFANCPITSVVMSNTIDSLGTCAFIYCSSLTNVTFSDSLRYIGNTCFRGAYLGDLVLPASVRVIKEAALSGAHITSITLSDSLEVLENWSLAMNQFSSLYIPASVREIGTPCWYMGESLTSIVVDANNPYYDSRDNCNAIISTTNGGVIQVCNNTILPEGITILYGDAFRGYTFDTLVVPSTVTDINIHEGQINKLVISSPQLGSLDLWDGVGTIQVLLDTPPIMPQNYGILTNPIQVPCNALSTYLADTIWGTFPNYLDILEYNINTIGNEHGTIVIEGPTCTNPIAILTAIPDSGYIFTQWSDGDTNNPRTVTVTQDTTFTAIWQVKPFEGIINQEYQGQMLYYRVIDPVNHYVMLTCPKDSLITDINWYDAWIDGWDNSNRPTGALVLPDMVTHNGITYTIRAIGACAFSGCPIFTVVIPNTVDSLGDAAFGGCSYLSEVTFSNALRYIGRYAFHGTNLGNVVLPPQVGVLKEYAFQNAHITNITLNDSLQKLERGCLAYNLFTSLYIPASIGDLDASFMSDDWTGMGDRLSSIVVDPNNPYYDSRNNSNAIINSETNQLLVGCKNTVIPESVNEISFSAFDGCSFETFVWPSWIINISVDNCWHGCHFNKLVVDSPTMIMYLCGSPADTIQVLNEAPPFLGISGDNGFDFDRPIIVVPCNSIPAYQEASGWSNFTHFIEDGMHNVTAQQTEHGNVTVVRPTCANPSATFTATADEGYHFVQWNDGDTNNPRIVPVTSDTTLTATFAINQYMVTVLTDSLSMGSVDGGGINAHGTTRTLTATANYGYHFVVWSDGITDATRTITVTNDTSLTAYFAVNQYTVNILSGDTTMGSVTGSGTSEYNTIRDITATANNGYHFVVWSDGDLNATRTITVTNDTTLTAYFALNTYLVTTLSANALMGSAQGGGTVFYGATCSINATAYYGYHFTQWSDGVIDATRTIAVTGDTTLTASFAVNQYTVTVVSDNITMGTVTGSGVSDYQSSHSIAATAATGYHFTHWSDGDSNAVRTLKVTRDSTLTASFAINQYTLMVESNDVTLGSVTGSGIFAHGTQATVSATAFMGHRFDHWSDGTLENPHTVTMLGDLNLSALFVEVDSLFIHDTTYVDVHDTTYIDVHDTTYIDVHDTTYIDIHDTTYIDVPYAVHDTTYINVYDTTYVNVPVHDTTVVTDTVTLTEYVPVHDTTVVTDTVTLTEYVPVHDTTYITITDTLMVTQYDTVTNTIYDTILNPIYDTTVVFNTDTLWLHDTVFVYDTIYIHDTIIVGMDEVEAINVKIYTSNGQIVVDGSEDNQVWLYDMNGRLMATKRDDHLPLRFDIPSSGAYLVKIGNYFSRKVVVIK